MLLTFLHIIPSLFSAPDDLSVSDDMIPGTVKSIKVSGVCGQGDYDLSTGKWKFGANDPLSTYVIEPNAPVKAGVITALTDKTSALMMIPQILGADAKVSMVFNDGAKDKTVSFSLKKTSWKAGNHITYVLSSSKITTLKMGDLTYPSGWNSVNDGATYTIRKAYDEPNSSVDAGLFVVNDENKVIAANVKLTRSGTSWSLPTGSKLKFSPKYNYFVYYPYQDNLTGLPVVNTPGCDVSSSTKFFAKAIANWKIDTDQSTPDKMNACDLQIGKATLDDDGCSVSFKMEHAMGLAEITLGAKTFDNNYYLSNYPSYTWKNGTTTFHAYAGISGHSFYKVADYRYVALVKPDVTTDFSCSSSTDDPDSWTENVSVKPAVNGVDRVIATSKRTSWPDISYNTMAVGDIYYSDGAITKPEDISAARANGKTPIGVIGYLGNNKWTESGTGSGYGGHALVMCLKNIDSNGTTDMGQGYRWYSKDTDCGGFKVDTGDKIRGSFDKDYGSGYKETVAKGSAFEAANAAKIYNTLPAPTNKCTGWFLPSAGQYYAVMSQLGGGIYPDDWKINEFFGNMTTVSGKINAALSKVGPDQYTEFFQGTNTCAWTSSESSFMCAVSVDSGVDDKKGPGSVRFNGGDFVKATTGPVRPFLAF